MKKLLFILLLLSNYSFSQVNRTLFQASGTSCSGPYGSNTFGVTLEAEKLTLNISITYGNDSYGTLSSNNGTDWDTVLQYTSGLYMIGIYCAMPSSTIGGEILTVTWAVGHRPTKVVFVTEEFTGCQTGGNGLNAIRQTITDNNTSADPSLTLATLNNILGNGVLAIFQNDANPFGGTPEGSWTEDLDVGCSTPNGFYAMYREGTTDNTPTVTASSSTWMGVALELRASGRRVTLIN